MANIQQAAKWMDAGRRVRRPQFEDGVSYRASTTDDNLRELADEDGWVLLDNSARKSTMHESINGIATEDLLADDWEIAE